MAIDLLSFLKLPGNAVLVMIRVRRWAKWFPTLPGHAVHLFLWILPGLPFGKQTYLWKITFWLKKVPINNYKWPFSTATWKKTRLCRKKRRHLLNCTSSTHQANILATGPHFALGPAIYILGGLETRGKSCKVFMESLYVRPNSIYIIHKKKHILTAGHLVCSIGWLGNSK